MGTAWTPTAEFDQFTRNRTRLRSTGVAEALRNGARGRDHPMFRPPRCPHAGCPRHADPGTECFFVRCGSYKPKCRAHPVPRFRCKCCKRGFSRQTFRADYRDHKPSRNRVVYELLVSGVGLRQSARIAKLARSTTTAKFKKMGRHVTELNENLRQSVDGVAVLQLDEIETYEGRRNTRPLTVPVVIERKTRFLIQAACAPIRPSGKMTKAREKAIAADERRFGRRPDMSKWIVGKVLEVAKEFTVGAAKIVLQTDEKSTYPGLAATAFGADRLCHQMTNSRLARGPWNELFPINHTEAMLRDLIGRLRRESWLVSKMGKYLDLHLQLYIAYRNYARPRFNYDVKTPAQLLGFEAEAMSIQDLISWRQDWGARSPHPLGRGGRSVEESRNGAR